MHTVWRRQHPQKGTTRNVQIMFTVNAANYTITFNFLWYTADNHHVDENMTIIHIDSSMKRFFVRLPPWLHFGCVA
jgi:hypothetical protein